MRFRSGAFALVLVIMRISLLSASGAEAPSVWFAPNSESPDFLEIFSKPESWASARKRVRVFKFGPAQLGTLSRSGLNSFLDLKNADAFKKLKQWGISIAIEAPAVKEWDCASERAARITLGYIRNVRSAGGEVSYVAMDEPLVSGVRSCQLEIEGAAVRTAAYVRNILRDVDNAARAGEVTIGDIEPYPSFSVDQLKRWINALSINGFKPGFFHLDVDLRRVASRPELDLASDLRELKMFMKDKGVSFGIIFWSGRDPESTDEDYYRHVIDYVIGVRNAIGRPEQSIFQSWVLRVSKICTAHIVCGSLNPRCLSSDPSYCGLRSVPINLPDYSREIFSHTKLINESLEIFGLP
jgi:hypothetical protein